VSPAVGGEPVGPAAPATLSLDQERTLVSEFFKMKSRLNGVWLTQTSDSKAVPMFGQLMDVLKRAGVDFATDSQPPSNPNQTGVVICIDDPSKPDVRAVALHEAFAAIGVATTYDVMNDRQRLRSDRPSIVLFVAPTPL
jgi:hypothetical protein